ncbi:MAG: PASTA domain-containing protein [Ignavibacteria bacterium]|nr:PASTA domain-containing protein [Ignavibacteria bacterium]
MWKRLLILFVGVIAMVLLFNSVIMPWYVKHTDTAKVPSVVGLNFLDAKKKIEAVGLEVKQGDIRYDENKPIGEIIDQNPPADQIVKYGRRIYLTVCGGEQLVEVPALHGRSLRDAKFTLEQRGLQVGETVRKNSNDVKEESVISQIIQPGSKVKRSTKIDLIISDGMIKGDLIVPDLIGKKLEDAKKLIADKKLKLGKITYQTNNDLPPGQIVDQYPKKDKTANENTAVDLFVSRKKKVETEEKPAVDNTPNDKKVPDADSGHDTKKEEKKVEKKTGDKEVTSPKNEPDTKKKEVEKKKGVEPKKDDKKDDKKTTDTKKKVDKPKDGSQ